MVTVKTIAAVTVSAGLVCVHQLGLFTASRFFAAVGNGTRQTVDRDDGLDRATAFAIGCTTRSCTPGQLLAATVLKMINREPQVVEIGKITQTVCIMHLFRSVSSPAQGNASSQQKARPKPGFSYSRSSPISSAEDASSIDHASCGQQAYGDQS
jgi:hypothetical protein